MKVKVAIVTLISVFIMSFFTDFTFSIFFTFAIFFVPIYPFVKKNKRIYWMQRVVHSKGQFYTYFMMKERIPITLYTTITRTQYLVPTPRTIPIMSLIFIKDQGMFQMAKMLKLLHLLSHGQTVQHPICLEKEKNITKEIKQRNRCENCF